MREGQKQLAAQNTTSQEPPSQLRTQALLHKLVTTLEALIAQSLTQPVSIEKVAEEKLVLAFLVSQRKALLQGLNSPPDDVSLRESLIENATLVEQNIELLNQSDAQRLLPLLQFLREQYSGLILHGISKPEIRLELKNMRKKIEKGISAAQEKQVIHRLASAHANLEKLISQITPKTTNSLLATLLNQ